METTFPRVAELSVVREARLAAWRPRPVPHWYRLGVGVAMGSYLALQDVRKPAVLALGSCAYVIALVQLIRRVTALNGMARMKGMPRPLVIGWMIPVGAMALTLLAVMGAIAALSRSHEWLWFGLAAVPVMYGGLGYAAGVYERRFDAWMASGAPGL